MLRSENEGRGPEAKGRGPYNRAGDRGPDKSNSLIITINQLYEMFSSALNKSNNDGPLNLFQKK